MCDEESFAKLRDQTAANTRQIADLAASDAVQSVQIKNLSEVTKTQGDNQLKLINRLVAAIICLLVLVVLALIFGALGERGFNGVVKAAPGLAAATISGECPETRGGDN